MTEPDTDRRSWLTPSIVALLLANSLPVIGALFLGWSVGAILGLYWAESAVVGVYTILKIATWRGTEDPPSARTPTLGLILFFTAHFGIFMLVHGFFVLLIAGAAEAGEFFSNDTAGLGLGDMFERVLSLLTHAWYAVGALVLSHGVSFVTNYLGNGEVRTLTQHQIVGQPYKRIFVMHLTLLIGAFVSVFIGAPPLVVALLVILKTVADVRQHEREHAAARRAAAVMRD